MAARITAYFKGVLKQNCFTRTWMKRQMHFFCIPTVFINQKWDNCVLWTYANTFSNRKLCSPKCSIFWRLQLSWKGTLLLLWPGWSICSVMPYPLVSVLPGAPPLGPIFRPTWHCCVGLLLHLQINLALLCRVHSLLYIYPGAVHIFFLAKKITVHLIFKNWFKKTQRLFCCCSAFCSVKNPE